MFRYNVWGMPRHSRLLGSRLGWNLFQTRVLKVKAACDGSELFDSFAVPDACIETAFPKPIVKKVWHHQKTQEVQKLRDAFASLIVDCLGVDHNDKNIKIDEKCYRNFGELSDISNSGLEALTNEFLGKLPSKMIFEKIENEEQNISMLQALCEYTGKYYGHNDENVNNLLHGGFMVNPTVLRAIIGCVKCRIGLQQLLEFELGYESQFEITQSNIFALLLERTEQSLHKKVA